MTAWFPLLLLPPLLLSAEGLLGRKINPCSVKESVPVSLRNNMLLNVDTAAADILPL